MMSARYQERLAKIEKILLIDNKKIDMSELRQACLYGIPEALRPLGWRLLLNYLPTDREKWKTFLEDHRTNYDSLIEQLIVKPGEQVKDETNSDHPLSEESTSEWNSYFEDNTMLSQIDKDSRRLCPEMQFFQMKTKYPHRSDSYARLSERVTRHDLETQDYDIARNISRKSEKSDEEPVETEEVHWQVVERILFIYAKVNPGVKYVQGMNELLGTIYYVIASDTDDEWSKWAEHDAFFCFQQLMSEIKDSFIKTLDNSSCGIEYTLSSFHNLVQSVDSELHDHFVTLGILPQFYAFRWISLLLCQEFPMPDVITIWDSLLSDQSRFSLLPFVCLAMLQMQRNELLKGDFAVCVKFLQSYPAVDGAQLVQLALSIREGSYKLPSSQQNGTKSRHMRTLSDKFKELKGILKR